MASEEQRDLKKELLKKDKLELVKLLKKKNQPTNGSKADMVDRLLQHDEKTGGKMARKASAAVKSDSDEYEEESGEYEEDEEEEEEEEKPKPKPQKKKKKKKKKSEGGGGGGAAPIDCGDCGCSPSVSRGGGIALAAQIFTALAVLGQLIVGFIQFINLVDPLSDVCNSDFSDCVGGSLFWEGSGDETDSFNWPWRAVFTFAPTLFFENWTPVLFALLAMMQMFVSTSWDIISGSWVRCMLFHLIMCLFAAFPYTGKAGIVVGFIEAIAGFFCLICALMRAG
eukprot:306373_1